MYWLIFCTLRSIGRLHAAQLMNVRLELIVHFRLRSQVRLDEHNADPYNF